MNSVRSLMLNRVRSIRTKKSGINFREHLIVLLRTARWQPRVRMVGSTNMTRKNERTDDSGNV
jgi:hypothetical protein